MQFVTIGPVVPVLTIGTIMSIMPIMTIMPVTPVTPLNPTNRVMPVAPVVPIEWLPNRQAGYNGFAGYAGGDRRRGACQNGRPPRRGVAGPVAGPSARAGLGFLGAGCAVGVGVIYGPNGKIQNQ